MTIDRKNNDIEEFELTGFARASLKLLKYIRNNNIPIRIFNSAKTKGVSRIYSPAKIFGNYRKYYYKVEYKEKFVDFLVKKFYENNPEPSVGIKVAFTRTLHQNRLHWKGCICRNKDEYDELNSDGVKKEG